MWLSDARCTSLLFANNHHERDESMPPRHLHCVSFPTVDCTIDFEGVLGDKISRIRLVAKNHPSSTTTFLP